MPDRKESAVGLALSREYALISWFTADLKDPVTCSTGKDEEPELIPVPAMEKMVDVLVSLIKS